MRRRSKTIDGLDRWVQRPGRRRLIVGHRDALFVDVLALAVALLPIYCWKHYGRSPGMALWGLYLVRDKPLPIRLGILRYLLLIGIVCFFLLVAVTALWRTWQAVAQLHHQNPVDEMLGIRVVRYEIPPPGRSTVERALDRLALFANLRTTDIDDDAQPHDWRGERD